EPALPARHHVQMDTVAAVLDRQERDQDDRHALVAGFAVRRADLGRGRVPRSDAPAPAADLCGVAVEAHVHRLQGPLASSNIIVFPSLSREGCSKSDRFQDGWILNMGGWRMSGLDGRE